MHIYICCANIFSQNVTCIFVPLTMSHEEKFFFNYIIIYLLAMCVFIADRGLCL